MGEAEAYAVYDIFINHRGTDTKKSVASLIYRRLIKYGLRVFLDQDELEAGDFLPPAIKSAINSSSIHIAIFSVRYAESSWCLNELLDMFESNCKIIPIFHDVQPLDLRYIEDGCYGDAFRNHENIGRHDVELIKRWKDALQNASKISGIKFKAAKDDFGVLVDKIVDKVLEEPKWKELDVDEHPVGLHQAAENFNNFIRERKLSGTAVVGIIGLHGSGKSTLVRHIYNCYLLRNLPLRKFKGYCFLSELNKNDLADLQRQLVRDLLGLERNAITNATEGKGKLRLCLRGKGPFLIVLDGLCEKEQIEGLLLVVKDVLADSLILVTCHDRTLLVSNHMNIFYNVKLLQRRDAHDLFCWHAFRAPKPPTDLEHLVEKILEICGGFPLALKEVGQYLSGDLDQIFWEEVLRDMQMSPVSVVSKVLEVTYNNLPETQKEVFWDVAHFLVGENKDLAVRVLHGLYSRGFICLKELQNKCLLDLEEISHCKLPCAKGCGICVYCRMYVEQWRTNGSPKIRMDDLVRDFARLKARFSTKFIYLRLCQLANITTLQEEVLGIKLHSRSDHVEGYQVRGIRCEYIDEPERQFQAIKKHQLLPQPWPSENMDTHEKIYGLRLLVLHDYRVTFPPFPFNRLSGDLIWLRMHKSNWRNTIPSTLSLRNLRVLELDGVKLEALGSMDGDEFPSKLDELSVDYCGESAEIPENNLPSSSMNSMEASSFVRGSVRDWFRFRELTNLVKMVFKNVKGLKTLPIDFEAIRNLRHLDLSGWTDLENMPDSFTRLLQLQYLALQDCMSLSISDLGGIAQLKYLDFQGCSSLRNLPEKTAAQRELRYLNLSGTNIHELPKDFKDLRATRRIVVIRAGRKEPAPASLVTASLILHSEAASQEPAPASLATDSLILHSEAAPQEPVPASLATASLILRSEAAPQEPAAASLATDSLILHSEAAPQEPAPASLATASLILHSEAALQELVPTMKAPSGAAPQELALAYLKMSFEVTELQSEDLTPHVKKFKSGNECCPVSRIPNLGNIAAAGSDEKRESLDPIPKEK